MFGINNHGANVYAKLGLETGVIAASPNKLIIMLYDGAILAAKQAMLYMHNQDYQKKGELISKAVLIIEGGLRASLNKNAGGDIALSLDALYVYISKRLMTANLQNQPALIEEVITLLEGLKSAWEAIEQQQVAKANKTSASYYANSGLEANLNRLALGA